MAGPTKVGGPERRQADVIIWTSKLDSSKSDGLIRAIYAYEITWKQEALDLRIHKRLK